MKQEIVGFMSDLNVKDDAVGLCKGMLLSYNPFVNIVDISHSVTPFDIEEGAMYLTDVPSHFPKNSIFIGVVFPETGTPLDSIIVRNEKNQLFVVPNNGLITKAIENCPAIEAFKITKIDLPQEMNSSFYGRDILVKGAALLASGIAANDLGERLPIEEIVKLNFPEPTIIGDKEIEVKIDIIDKNFGNIWTNLEYSKIKELGIKDGQLLKICNQEYELNIQIPFLKSFGYTKKGNSLAYINSRGKMAFGINQGNFAKKYNIKRGESISIIKLNS